MFAPTSTEGVRDARTLGWTTGMSLDVRLGVRMLRKYPALTCICGFAMAFAILVGAAGFELVTRFVFPSLPIAEGDRVVTIQNWDAASQRAENPTLHDVVRWQQELATIEDLGAFRNRTRNLIAADRVPTLVGVVEVTASVFQLARVPALLGRPLAAEDERPDSAPVVVVGHALWQRHFDGDPAIIGRTVRLGRTVHTIVGVMPARFESPTGGTLWVPLRLDVPQHQPGDPGVRVIGRLADAVTMSEAQAELTAVGGRAAAGIPGTRDIVTPRVEPYAASLLQHVSGVEFLTINLFLILLVVIICANVALLMFARAAAREGEIVVRSALGATRGRIIWQLFAEALLLAAAAAAVGLIAADAALRWKFGLIEVVLGPNSGAPAFWDRSGLSPATVFYACLLAVLAALVAGVVPALKVTGALDRRLRMATAGGGGFRFGGVWTAVVILQVAAMVAFPVLAGLLRGEAVDIRAVQSGSEEFLSARLEMDRDTALGAPIDASRAGFVARFAATFRELEDKLEAEPAVAGVTFSDGLPLMSRWTRPIELDGGMAATPDPDGRRLRVKSAAVAADYFPLMNAPATAGRGFRAADMAPGARVVIVNQSFVDRILGGGNAVGRRVRYAEPPGFGEVGSGAEPWYEIIGVVRDIGRPAGREQPESAGIYHPAAPGSAIPAYLVVHVKGRPESFVPRLRALAAGVDPTIRIHDAVPLNEVRRVEMYLLRLGFWLVTGVSAGALLLSLAGIHSVLSFTVSQRTREIGLRVALGGEGWRVAATVARRPLAQVAAGVLLGGVLTAAMLHAVNARPSPGGAARLLAYLALMIGIALLAAIVPARRVLRIEPTEALKMDG
ncbi:MAG: hypothetical protein A3G21_12465 [Acidobacteria bacterium RIFCSPLOWO2_12_FULL_66_21]|nr:MAG: hypothetical protein A3G21_12465 [Acidobacteria bacterium RIFCSPLOWO2_12_FULL_66_21]